MPQELITQLLVELSTADVEFIVVGGVAAVLQGAPITTADLDIVHRRTPENITKLLEVLLRLDAYCRGDLARRRLPPQESHLVGRGHLNLQTNYGLLDVLCELAEQKGYEELLPHTKVLIDGEVRFHVLDLPTLIEVKRATGRAKDRIVLPVLLAMLDTQTKEQTG